MAERTKCEICSAEQPEDNAQPGTLWLGQHKSRAHGIAGKGPKGGRRSGRKRTDRAPGSGSKSPRTSLKADLRATFKLAGGIVGVVDPYCGDILERKSDRFCDALARVAAEDERINRWLRRVGKAGPYGALVAGVAAIVVPIASHHGFLPPEVAVLAGAPVPPIEVEPVEPDEPSPNGHVHRASIADVPAPAPAASVPSIADVPPA